MKSIQSINQSVRIQQAKHVVLEMCRETAGIISKRRALYETCAEQDSGKDLRRNNPMITVHDMPTEDSCRTFIQLMLSFFNYLFIVIVHAYSSSFLTLNVSSLLLRFNWVSVVLAFNDSLSDWAPSYPILLAVHCHCSFLIIFVFGIKRLFITEQN